MKNKNKEWFMKKKLLFKSMSLSQRSLTGYYSVFHIEMNGGNQVITLEYSTMIERRGT